MKHDFSNVVLNEARFSKTEQLKLKTPESYHSDSFKSYQNIRNLKPDRAISVSEDPIH